MKRALISDTNKLSFLDEFISPGPFAKIPFITFKNLIINEKLKDKLWISTSKGKFFIKATETLPFYNDNILSLLESYQLYFCKDDTGECVYFWVDVGDMPAHNYITFKKLYITTKHLYYKRIIKSGFREN